MAVKLALNAISRILFFAFYGMAGPVFGQTPAAPLSQSDIRGEGVPSPARQPFSQSAPELTEEDLLTFFDGLLPYALRNADVAGGVVSIVKDGHILFAKGYGYADIEKRTPVTPDTVFRPGSVGKLFTWTAVMQLVEAGKLDLDRDVSEYVDFTVPRKFEQPITLRHLMTHTPGYEDVLKELFVPSANQLVSLAEYLKDHPPEQIYPAGDIVAYSNYGTVLAGYIVERVAGEPFVEYVAKHILQPLGMRHSTFVQPPPSSLAAMMSNGYRRASEVEPRPFEFLAPPAGSLSSTGSDMARFMLAHLQNGELGGARILKPETAALMRSHQYRAAPDRNGFALGFFEQNRNGLRIIGHGGDTRMFHSALHLIPERNVGFFISLNSDGGDQADAGTVRTAVFHAFLDRYFPFTPRTTASSRRQSTTGE